MRTSIIFSSILAAVSASVIKRDESVLDIKLTKLDNTLVKATITNTGPVALNLLKSGTFLDSAHVKKLSVASTAGDVPFTGIRKRIRTSGLSSDAFAPLGAGETMDIEVDMAAVHDVTTSGDYKVSMAGVLPYAEAGSTELVPGKALTYESNVLKLAVDGAKAALVPRALERRSKLQTSSCSSSQQSAIKSGLQNCASLARTASSSAKSGGSKFQEYFKSASTTTVSNRLAAVANECASYTSGATTLYCQDVYSACDSNTLAYTQPSNNVVVACPIFFSDLPNLSRTCHAQDQSTTLLHEFTHAPGVYSPGTVDNAYGYSASTRLTASQALNNADSYALYANALYVGC